jgi:hypothetical protein
VIANPIKPVIRPVSAVVRVLRGTSIIFCILSANTVWAAPLPEQRASALYQQYSGGGVDIAGAGVQVDKKIAEDVSFSATYGRDTIENQEIDVVTSASPYKETRRSYGLGAAYLNGDAVLKLDLAASSEPDYDATSVDMNIYHQAFSGLTEISMGYSRGWDEVKRVDTGFNRDVDRWKYRLGLTQIVTANMKLKLGYEAISEQGYLGDPYRSARVLNASIAERVPGTRTSNAVAINMAHAISDESAVKAEYRYYWDTWDIAAHTLELGYSRQFGSHWLTDIFYRHYRQDSASFFNDNFPVELNFMSRDKALSQFQNNSLGFKLGYMIDHDAGNAFIQRSGIHLSYEFLSYDYDQYTDIRNGQLYSFNADLIQLMFSIWY